MNARKMATLIAAATMAATGSYVFIYLARWEWNRALVSAAIFLAAELGLVALVLIARLQRVEQALTAPAVAAGADAWVHRHIRDATRPEAEVSFDWLVEPRRTGVFVPVLMGAGVVLSAIAWVVERIARATVGPVAERGLSRRLGPLELPPHGLLHRADADPLALLRGPVAGGPS
jgi:hypothetical protein